MKLFFDENLSHKLVALLESEFPGSSHPELEGKRGATDLEVWEYARANGFVIVSKDNDFRQRVFLEGSPPKVIWLSVGNAGTGLIANLLRENLPKIQNFVSSAEEELLVLE